MAEKSRNSPNKTEDQPLVKPQFFATLNSVTSVFTEYKQTLINVVGHTDSTGDVNHNYDLSRRRAASVNAGVSRSLTAPTCARIGSTA